MKNPPTDSLILLIVIARFSQMREQDPLLE